MAESVSALCLHPVGTGIGIMRQYMGNSRGLSCQLNLSPPPFAVELRRILGIFRLADRVGWLCSKCPRRASCR